MGRPKNVGKKISVRYQVTVTQDVARTIKKLGKMLSLSGSGTIAFCLETFLTQKNAGNQIDRRIHELQQGHK